MACGRDLNPAIQDFDDSCFTGGLGAGLGPWAGLGLGRGPGSGLHGSGRGWTAWRACLPAVPSTHCVASGPALTLQRLAGPAGKYVTGDINEAYLRNLEEQGRGKRRARPGRKATLVPSAAADAGADRAPAATA